MKDSLKPILGLALDVGGYVAVVLILVFFGIACVEAWGV